MSTCTTQDLITAVTAHVRNIQSFIKSLQELNNYIYNPSSTSGGGLLLDELDAVHMAAQEVRRAVSNKEQHVKINGIGDAWGIRPAEQLTRFLTQNEDYLNTQMGASIQEVSGFFQQLRQLLVDTDEGTGYLAVSSNLLTDGRAVVEEEPGDAK